MTPHTLANLIPSSNAFHLPKGIRRTLYGGRECVVGDIYQAGGIVGAFLDTPDSPDWARRIARYDRADFHKNSPHKNRFFSDIASTIKAGEGQSFPTFRHALDAWHAGGKQGVPPYQTSQNYGSCVDCSRAEHDTVLLGWRAAQPQFNEEYRHPVALYLYPERGYCSDGWSGSACASVARRVGVAFRIKYEIGGNSIDFTDDDQNEQICARTWCRSGIPAWLKEHTQKNHPYEDGAITEFDGDITALRDSLAAGGCIHTGGVKTSGGSKPFTPGSVGPHMQSIVGGDDSHEFRKYCQDVIGVKPRSNDFPVVFNQTWGAGWSGECADKYWPSHLWGHKPEGAWVVWASQALDWFRGDMYLWLPRLKGFPRATPVPIPPIPPGPTPIPAVTVIGGVLELRGPVNIPAGEVRKFIVVPKPEI